jgi:hydroxymethylpyrimidine pyrophosphatase-like HAD family hydrolase
MLFAEITISWRTVMTFRALATDYDGTIAQDGRVDVATTGALANVRATGCRLILVTGRELADLLDTCDCVDVFDRVVAENGAVLYEPATTRSESLAARPPDAFVEHLAKQRIPLSVGRSVVATAAPYAHVVRSAIHERGLEWHLIFNKGSVMALPADVTKATGLTAALRALGVSHDETIGVGDAENDQVFLRQCGLAVAVANALPSVKDIADLITDSAGGAGVIELIGRWQRGELDDVQRGAHAGGMMAAERGG